MTRTIEHPYHLALSILDVVLAAFVREEKDVFLDSHHLRIMEDALMIFQDLIDVGTQ